MKETSNNAPKHFVTEGNFKLLLSIILIVTTLSGLSWHVGYWSTFNYNYFEFISFTDLFRTSFYPFYKANFITILIWTLSTGVTYLMLAVQARIRRKKNLPFIKNVPISNEEKFGFDILLGLSGIGFFIMYILVDSPVQYILFIIPYMLGVFGLVFRFLRPFIGDGIVKVTIVIVFLTLPGLNFVSAKQVSLRIIQGDRATVVTQLNSSDRILNKICVGRPYLGSSADYVFVYLGYYQDRATRLGNKGGEVLAIKRSSITSFVTSDHYELRRIALHRRDFFDSISLDMQVDSIMRSLPSDSVIESLIKKGLISYPGWKKKTQ